VSHTSVLKKALLNPKIYPNRPDTVGFCETHISLLFFTGAHVYKVKKPVDFGFLDFTTLEKRKYFCEQEVRLNRRLAPELYLGVVKITAEGGRIQLGGSGVSIEYAVVMKQVAEDHMMNRLLENNQVSPKMVEAISEKLVRFYADAETSEVIRSFGKPERIKEDTDENFDQTKPYIDRVIPRDIYETIQNRTNRFLLEEKSHFHERIRSDKIRDCHGDLRLEHIFWGDTIAIFDCIEFNERFRYTDVAADIAFLGMDLDFHGREDLSAHLIRAYVGESGDHEVEGVLDFYKCYRAYVRGKVESFRLDDPHIPEKEKGEAQERARKYFDLSYAYAQKF
jgi:aminoglycoside phosphotransferase family enzyme